MKKFFEETITTKEIFKGKIIDVQLDNVLLPNGKKAQREIVKHPGAVAVIAITKDKKIVLVEQFRKPLELSIIEIPAGKIEFNEQPAVTAVRELEEETGYTTNGLTYLTSFYTSPGFANEIIHIYYTNEIEKLTVKPAADEDEFVEVMELTLQEAVNYMIEQRIYDAKTVYAIQYLQLTGGL